MKTFTTCCEYIRQSFPEIRKLPYIGDAKEWATSKYFKKLTLDEASEALKEGQPVLCVLVDNGKDGHIFIVEHIKGIFVSGRHYNGKIGRIRVLGNADGIVLITPIKEAEVVIKTKKSKPTPKTVSHKQATSAVKKTATKKKTAKKSTKVNK